MGVLCVTIGHHEHYPHGQPTCCSIIRHCFSLSQEFINNDRPWAIFLIVSLGLINIWLGNDLS